MNQKIEFRRWYVGALRADGAREGRGQAFHSCADSQQDRGAQALDMRRIANELYGIAKPLFFPQQDRLATQVLTRPNRPAEVDAQREKGFIQPAKLVVIPPGDEPSSLQQRMAIAEVPKDVGPLSEVSVKQIEGFWSSSGVRQMNAEIDKTL